MSKGTMIGLGVGVVAIILIIFIFMGGGDTTDSLIEEAKTLNDKCSSRELSPQECTDAYLDLGKRWTEAVKDMSPAEAAEATQKWLQVYGY